MGLILSFLPISFGSTKFPTKIWTINKNINVKIGSDIPRNWIIEKIKGIKTDNNEPIKGIKFKMKAKIPNEGAKSFLRRYKIKKVRTPERKLVNVFNSK